MDLDLNDLVRPPRAMAQVLGVREIVESDLPALSAPRASAPRPIDKLRYKHHALARALANGLSETEAGLVAGYDSTYVSILKTDPAFSELVRFYQGENSRAFDAINEGLAGLSGAAIDELQRRLDEDPGSMAAGFLKDLIAMTADRTGRGPSSKVTTEVNVQFANRLEAARKRVVDAEFKVIEK